MNSKEQYPDKKECVRYSINHRIESIIYKPTFLSRFRPLDSFQFLFSVRKHRYANGLKSNYVALSQIEIDKSTKTLNHRETKLRVPTSFLVSDNW